MQTSIRHPSIDPSTIAQSSLVLAIAIAITAGVAFFTNTNQVAEFAAPYNALAETGIALHKDLYAPCVYRFVSPMMAGGTARALGVSTDTGFLIVNIAASIALLCLTYAVARRVGADFTGGLVAMTAVGIGIGHLKNNMFFNNGMEAVAQVMMLGWCLAMFGQRWVLATVICCVGMCTREMFLIPAALMAGRLSYQAWQTRDAKDICRLFVIVGCTVASFVLPRWLIPVSFTFQLIDPLYDDHWFTKLMKVPLNMRRNVNILLGALCYSLPTFMLLTRERFRAGWEYLRPYHLAGAVYCCSLFVLTLYGGTDLYRYLTYFFFSQTFCLAALFASKDLRPHWTEVALMLIVVAFHNRLFSEIPSYEENPKQYLDFWPAFEDRLKAPAIRRFLEAIAALTAAYVLRRTLAAKAAGKSTIAAEPATDSTSVVPASA